MGHHSVFVTGGEDGEAITLSGTLSGEDVGNNCRLVCVVRGETHIADASDFFEALRIIRRRVLEPMGLIPLCYGASLKVWPSRMAREMGRGLKAYKMEAGKMEAGAPASELVDIFEEGPDIIPATVQHQEDFARDWLAAQ